MASRHPIMAPLQSPLLGLVQALCAPYGGLVSADALARRLPRETPQPLSWVARRIVSRELLVLNTPQALWLPAFQFTQPDCDIHPGVARVLSHLQPAFSDWEIALWFTLEHPALAQRRPVELLGTDDDAITRMAFADAQMQHMPSIVGTQPC